MYDGRGWVGMLTHFSLFSGIGGLDLAAEWAGFQTVGQCEWADYPTKVLEKHWPDVPRWRDIRSVTAESFRERTGMRTVDVISGGFPCQPFSVAGKRKGKEDDRYLWPEMLRVISELQPPWVIGENVAGIVTMALDQVLFDLESLNYTCQAIIIPACAVNAPHRRDRTAIMAWNSNGGHEQKVGEIQEWERTESSRICLDVADTDSDRRFSQETGKSTPNKKRNNTALEQAGWPEFYEAVAGRSTVPDANGERLQIARQQSGFKEIFAENRTQFGDWWTVEPNVGRVANGIPNRVDRLKCLGNAVVPQQFYPIFQAIADIESEVSQ